MFDRIKSNKYFNILKEQWQNYFYIISVTFLALKLAFSSGHFFPVILYSIIYMGLMITAKYLGYPLIRRYILASVSFVLYTWVTQTYSISYTYDSTFNASFLLLIVYAYLLTDMLSPILIGLTIAIHIQSDVGERSIGQIMGNTRGVITQAVSVSIIFRLVRYLLAERNKYRKLSITDSLTGIATLGHTLELGQQMINEGASVTILVTDMDRFKQINDTYGHVVGNKVLIQVAELLQEETTGLDCVVGRLGGDEFIIIVRDYPFLQIESLSNRLFNSMKDKLFIVDPEIDPIKLSFSVGEAHNSTNSPISIEKLLHNADVNMYFNKYRNHRINIYASQVHPILSSEGYELLNVLAEKDMYTYVHSGYTAQYAAALAKELKLSDELVQALYTAGWLHDLGKTLISSDIVRKNCDLSNEEYEIIKQHVSYGLSILKHIHLSESVINGIQYHHERWDGSGYPFNMSGEKIPLEGRILQIADSYAAMSIKRVYRKTLSADDAINEIKKHRGTQFDPNLVDIFTMLLEKEKIA